MDTSISQSMVEPGSVRCLSRPTSAWVTMAATVVKGLQISWRYLPNLVGNIVNLGIRLAFYMILSNVVALRDPQSAFSEMSGRELFIFFQGALLLFVFNYPTLWGPIRAVTDDLYNGTLEFLYSTPCSRYAYYVGTVVAQSLIQSIVFLPLYLFLIFYSQASAANMLMVLLVCVTVLIAVTAMGIMIGLLALLWRQVGSIADVLGILFELLAGAYLPVTAFPQWLQYMAYLLPYTWGYDLIRYYSLEGNWPTLLPVWQEWGMLALYAVLYTLLSRYLLARAEVLAKRTGLHVI
jgi:ABC-2 type transport system permease protein